MNLIERIHASYIHPRRIRVLVKCLNDLVPRDALLLDVGCGDGLLASQMQQARPDVQITCLDVIARSHTHFPVDVFDGHGIPHKDASFDVVMFVDVLHHIEDPIILLREATRVARKIVLIKDHLSDGLFSNPVLRFMDRVGNVRHGVVLPYNYWTQDKWFEAFRQLKMIVSVWENNLRLYPMPLDVIFGRSLHFIAKLDLRENP